VKDNDDSMGHAEHYCREYGQDVPPPAANSDVVFFVWILLVIAMLFGASLTSIFFDISIPRP